MSDEGPQNPLNFPQPECSCEPSSSGIQRPESRSSLPYTQEAPEPSLPQTLHSHQQPEVSEGTVDDHGVNVPSTVTNPVSRGIISPPPVASVPATETSPVASSDTAALNTAGGQIAARERLPGQFGSVSARDPYSMRQLYPVKKDEEPEPEAPPEEKKSIWAKVVGLFG